MHKCGSGGRTAIVASYGEPMDNAGTIEDLDEDLCLMSNVRPAGKPSKRHLELVRRWIDLNQDVIVAHWDGEMQSSRDVLNALKPLPKS